MDMITFSVESFWSYSAEKICGEPFNISEIFGHRTFLYIRRGYHNFLLKLFLSDSAEKLRGGNQSMLVVYKKAFDAKRRGRSVQKTKK